MKYSAEVQEDRLVVAVGPSATEAARVAGEMGWGVEEVSNLERAGDLLAVAGNARVRNVLILAPLDDFPPDAFVHLAARLCRDAPSLAAGFAYGRDGEQLLAAVRRLISHSPAPLRESFHAAVAHPKLAHIFSGARVRRAMDPGSPPAEELLTAGAELLYLAGNSNGHDADVGGAVLCRRGALEGSPRPEHAFPCYAGAACRYGDSALRVVTADAVNARAVVSFTCWGVAPRTPFSPETNIGEALGGGGVVRTLVTPLRAVMVERADFLALYYACGLGLPLGQAVAIANRARLARGLWADLLCFGDPDLRLAPRVVDVASTPDAAGYFSVDLPPGPADVRVILPDAAASDSLAVIEDGPKPDAAWLGEGALFLTVHGTRPGRLVFSCPTADQVLHASAGLAELLDDVTGLTHLCWALSNEHAAPPAETGLLATELGAAARVLHKWWMVRVRPGQVLSRRRMDEEWASLDARLNALGSAVLTACAGACALGGLVPMRLARARAVHTREDISAHPCSYCGSKVAEEQWEIPFTRHSRRRGNCFCCGAIFDGDPESARSMEITGPLRAGCPVTVRIPVCNPYSVAAPASAFVVLGGYDPSRPQPSARSTPIRLPPGGRGEVTVEMMLKPVDSLARGIYYLSAVLVVGARVTFLRRPTEVLS